MEDSVPWLAPSQRTALLPSCWRDLPANCSDEGGGWSQSPVSQIATWEGGALETSLWAWGPLLIAGGLKRSITLLGASVSSLVSGDE